MCVYVCVSVCVCVYAWKSGYYSISCDYLVCVAEVAWQVWYSPYHLLLHTYAPSFAQIMSIICDRKPKQASLTIHILDCKVQHYKLIQRCL